MGTFTALQLTALLFLGPAPSTETGTEDTGTEDTGTEDTGTEDTGTEDTGTEVFDPGCLCPDVWAPVCGVDGKTYGNKCGAGCSNVKIRHRGRCPGDCTIAPIPPGTPGLELLGLGLLGLGLLAWRRASPRA